MSLFHWLLLLLLSVLWGGSFFFVEILLDELPPLTIVTLRVGLAALVLWPIVLVRGLPLPTGLAGWAALALLSLLNNVIPFSLIVWGQTGISGGLASILNATTPVFTALIASTFLADERLTVDKTTGVLLGLAGVVVMIGPNALLDMGAGVLAQLAVIGASLSYGFAATYGRRFSRAGMPALVVATCQLTCSALLLAIPALLVDAPFELPAPSTRTWLVLVALAVLSTALAYQLYFALLAGAGATNTSLVTILVPVSAVILGGIFLGERLDNRQWLGMLVIALGLIAIDGRWRRRRRPAPA